MKVWVSKYALTSGIQEMDGFEIYVSNTTDSVRYATRQPLFFRMGTDAHETPEEAKAYAEQMRVKKLESLRKQIARIEKLKF